MVLQPRLSSCHQCPIQTLATYLDQLLRPLFESYSRSTSFTNGTDFIQKLQHYCLQEGCLLPQTKFITFQIHNLYTRISHTDILTALNQFLVNPIMVNRHQRLTSDAIEELVAIFLRNNIFSYSGKIYRYVKGSPFNFPLTQLLGDIYLHHWQVLLLRKIRIADKFYGRYHDMGILTWDGPMDELQACFSKLNEQYPDVQLTTSTSSHVHFISAYVENRKGSLYTRVYHDPLIQPFLLPYTVEHPRLWHRQWFRFALIRAGLYCTLVEDFNDERLHIELTFLANGYSYDCVEYHMRLFFQLINLSQTEVPLNQYTYSLLRTELFRYRDRQKREFEQQQQQQSEKNPQPIQLHYLFDWGSRWKFNEQFHKLWSTNVEADPTFKKYGLKIKLNSKHCYTSNALLSQL